MPAHESPNYKADPYGCLADAIQNPSQLVEIRMANHCEVAPVACPGSGCQARGVIPESGPVRNIPRSACERTLAWIAACETSKAANTTAAVEQPEAIEPALTPEPVQPQQPRVLPLGQTATAFA